ncbi:MAG TPA: GFA family protein [Burkholderiales bacterium]|nr:GFA family protein [Burkholderiales bacterium]
MLSGGCFCGRIRYEVTGTPFHETNCHCSICRRTTGAPFVTWFSVSRSQFRILSGEPTRFRSTMKATRSFCAQCGAQLTFEHEDFMEEIDVTTCSLDDPNALPPKDHTYTSSKVSWIEVADQLPEYEEGREGRQ